MEKLRAYLNSLSTDDQFFFARRCDTTVGYLRKAISANGKLGEEIVAAIERHSGGQVRIEDLRPDLNADFVRAQPRRRRRSAA